MLTIAITSWFRQNDRARPSELDTPSLGCELHKVLDAMQSLFQENAMLGWLRRCDWAANVIR